LVRHGSTCAYAGPAATSAVATTRRTAAPRSTSTRRIIRSSKATTRPKVGGRVASTRLCSISAIAPRRTTVRSLATIESDRALIATLTRYEPIRTPTVTPPLAVFAVDAEMNRIRLALLVGRRIGRIGHIDSSRARRLPRQRAKGTGWRYAGKHAVGRARFGLGHMYLAIFGSKSKRIRCARMGIG